MADEALERAMQILRQSAKRAGASSPYGKMLHVSLDDLASSKIVRKPFWFPWGESSTTTARDKIYLAKNWDSWSGGDTNRAGHLVHEAQHLRQRREAPGGDLLFTANYLTSEHTRLLVELPALKMELWFFRNEYFNFKPDLAKWVENNLCSHHISDRWRWRLYEELKAWWDKIK